MILKVFSNLDDSDCVFFHHHKLEAMHFDSPAAVDNAVVCELGFQSGAFLPEAVAAPGLWFQVRRGHMAALLQAEAEASL